MCTRNLCFEQKYENSKKKNQPKIVIFTAVKNRCLLHGCVFVMNFKSKIVKAYTDYIKTSIRFRISLKKSFHSL